MFASNNRRLRHLLAMDWDALTLRVAHAQFTKRGVKVERVLSVRMPSDVDPINAPRFGAFIRQALDQEGITTRHAAVDIPRDRAILNTLTLPTVNVDALAGMVQIQIAKELPYPVGDAVIDFAAEGAAREGATSNVLVAAVRREVVSHYESICEAAGLKLDRIGLRPYASRQSIRALLEPAMPERVVVVDLGPFLTEIAVLRNGTLTFCRAASVHIPPGIADRPLLSLVRPVLAAENLPDADLHDAEAGGASTPTKSDVIQSLVVELTRSIEAYRATDPGARIDHVVIGGDLGIEETLSEVIQKRLGVTTEIYNPARVFGWEPDEGASASAFAATLGLILGYVTDEAAQFDFLHPKRSESAVRRKLRRAPLVAAVGFLFLAAAGVAVAGLTRADRTRLAELQAQIAQLEENRDLNRKFLELVEGPEGLESFDNGQLVWVDVLLEAFTCLPSNEELVVDQLDMQQRDARLVFKTRSKRRETAMGIIQCLHAFRRAEEQGQRFRASLGPQTEKAKDKYPFSQDLRVEILNDAPEVSYGSTGKTARAGRTAPSP